VVIAGNPAQCPALTIEDAVQFAIERNERSLAADDRAAAARARVAKARSFFFPTLELRGDYTRRSYETTRVVEGEELTIQSRDALEGRATVEQRIFEARAFPAYRQARLARDAEQYAASDTKRLLAFDAAEAFLATLGAGEVREAAAQRLDLARRSLADARARFDAGLVGSNDVTRASLEAANAEREDVRTRGLLEAALLHLGFLIDEESPDSLETPERLLAEAAARVEDADSLAVAAAALRPDIESDRREAAALHASIEEARLRAIPDLGFTGEYNVTNESGLSGRDNDWSLGLGLTWQLFDGGVRGADRAERTALASAADLGVREGERRADLEVRTALVALTSAQATTDQARVAVEAARRNADETSELYRQGLASALEMVDAGVQLFEAEVDLARTEFGLGLAFLELRSALGLDPLGREVTP
jgi:outer membrane protein TolC